MCTFCVTFLFLKIQIHSTGSPGNTDNNNSKKVNLANISYEKKFQNIIFFLTISTFRFTISTFCQNPRNHIDISLNLREPYRQLNRGTLTLSTIFG